MTNPNYFLMLHNDCFMYYRYNGMVPDETVLEFGLCFLTMLLL